MQYQLEKAMAGLHSQVSHLVYIGSIFPPTTGRSRRGSHGSAPAQERTWACRSTRGSGIFGPGRETNKGANFDLATRKTIITSRLDSSNLDMPGAERVGYCIVVRPPLDPCPQAKQLSQHQMPNYSMLFMGAYATDQIDAPVSPPNAARQSSIFQVVQCIKASLSS